MENIKRKIIFLYPQKFYEVWYSVSRNKISLKHNHVLSRFSLSVTTCVLQEQNLKGVDITSTAPKNHKYQWSVPLQKLSDPWPQLRIKWWKRWGFTIFKLEVWITLMCNECPVTQQHRRLSYWHGSVSLHEDFITCALRILSSSITRGCPFWERGKMITFSKKCWMTCQRFNMLT